MAEKVIARWEWRTFCEDLSAYRSGMTDFKLEREVRSSEKYILSSKTQVNIKIRNKLLDIKMPLRIDKQNALEQWTVFGKYSFPLSVERVAAILVLENVERVWLAKDSYPEAEFLEEIVSSHKSLRIMPVEKERYVYRSGESQVEYSLVKFLDEEYATIAIEGTNPKEIIELRRKLGLEGQENINYLQAMKRILFQSC